MLKEKKYFLFDIDGTLSVGTTLYDGTKEFLDWIEETGGRCFYITNNSTKSRKDYVEKFAAWGITTEEAQFMTAPSRHTPTYPLRNAFPVAAVSLLPNAAMGTGAKAV